MMRIWKKIQSDIRWYQVWILIMILIRSPIQIHFFRIPTSPYPYPDPCLLFQPWCWQASTSKWKQEKIWLVWWSCCIQYCDATISSPHTPPPPPCPITILLIPPPHILNQAVILQYYLLPPLRPTPPPSYHHIITVKTAKRVLTNADGHHKDKGRDNE